MDAWIFYFSGGNSQATAVSHSGPQAVASGIWHWVVIRGQSQAEVVLPPNIVAGWHLIIILTVVM